VVREAGSAMSAAGTAVGAAANGGGGWGVNNGTRAALYRDWLLVTHTGATARKVLDPSVFLYNQAAPNVVDFVTIAGVSLGGPCSVHDHGARPSLGAGKKELG
jgi:hypothetical protein